MLPSFQPIYKLYSLQPKLLVYIRTVAERLTPLPDDQYSESRGPR